MEIKTFTKFEKARIKRTAQNVDQYVSRKNRLVAKVTEMNEEINNLQQMIDLSDAPVKLMTGGYGVEELINKVVTPTDKLDKNGNVIKQTTYEFKYPDTIIPPVVEAVMPSNGNDYDADAEEISNEETQFKVNNEETENSVEY